MNTPILLLSLTLACNLASQSAAQASRLSPPAPASARYAGTTDSNAADSNAENRVVFESTSLPLFRDEAEAVERAAFAFLETHLPPGMPLVPYADSLAIRRAAEQRHFHPNDVRACGLALPAGNALRIHFAGAKSASLLGLCSEGECTLRLEVSQRPPFGEDGGSNPVVKWTASVSPPHATSDWLDAVSRLAPSESATDLRGLLVGGAPSAQSSVPLLSVVPFGPWSPAPTLQDLAAIQPHFSQCSPYAQSSSSNRHALLSISQDGAVSRCEMNDDHRASTDLPTDCYCNVLRQLRFAPVEEDTERRLDLDLMPVPQTSVTIGSSIHRATIVAPPTIQTLFWQRIRFDERGLSECFANARLDPSRRIGIDIQFRADGMPAHVAVQGVLAQDQILAACLGPAVQNTRAGCTRSGHAESIHLELRNRVETAAPSVSR